SQLKTSGHSTGVPASQAQTPTHVTLAVVLRVSGSEPQTLLWQRAKAPDAGAWSLPGGYLEAGETLEDSIRRHLAAKVDVRELYPAALGHEVSATNLQRVLVRRELLEDTGERRPSGPHGGRPATVFRFREHRLAITDQFAVLRPPAAV